MTVQTTQLHRLTHPITHRGVHEKWTMAKSTWLSKWKLWNCIARKRNCVCFFFFGSKKMWKQRDSKNVPVKFCHWKNLSEHGENHKMNWPRGWDKMEVKTRKWNVGVANVGFVDLPNNQMCVLTEEARQKKACGQLTEPKRAHVKLSGL